MSKHDDFFSAYMEYCKLDASEAPAVYHRWTCASIVGALFGRGIHVQLGPYLIYPNQYIMLMGTAGARKGSAMSVGKGLLKGVGYNRFAADKTSKERFLSDMKQYDLPYGADVDDLELLSFDDPAESYICSGEFTDFIGQGNMEFVTMLTNLWDNLGSYENPKLTGKSVRVEKPTVNLLGANTPEGFALAFPPEAIGNGFLSRCVMIWGDPSGNKIAWPEALDSTVTEALVAHLQEAKENIKGLMDITDKAKVLGSAIYKEEVPIEDSRFASYKQRRHIHMLKLAMVLAAVDLTNTITDVHILRANTMLAMAERKMPKALGEFGASRHCLFALFPG